MSSTQISSIYVPPCGPDDAEIVIIGEAPGETEEKGNESSNFKPKPFIGSSGELLDQVLSRNGIARESVKIFNLCPYRPHQNKFEHLVGSQQLKDGIKAILDYLEARVSNNSPPKLLILLGNYPLRYLTNDHSRLITDWRGSILSGPFGIKCIATYHPSYIIRNRSELPVFDSDIKRCYADSKFSDLRILSREKVTVKSSAEYEMWTEEILKHDLISVDIETFGPRLACIGFSFDPRLGITFAANHHNDSFIQSMKKILESPNKKIFLFGTFDINRLYEEFGIDTINYYWDTMVAQHVMWPELPRGLDYLTSIYTRQPYYKPKAGADKNTKVWALKKFETVQDLYDYNGIDCCVTLEIALEQMKEMDEGPEEWRDTMSFEMEEHEVAFSISRAGLPIDHARRQVFLQSVSQEIIQLEGILNALAMKPINSNSPKQVQELLYIILGLPKQYKKNPKSPTGQSITSDEDACVKLLSLATDDLNKFKSDEKKFHAQRCIFIITNILTQRGLDKLRSNYLDIGFLSRSGYAHSLFIVPGPYTGRWSAAKYDLIEDVGLNGQTFPRGDVEVPDAITA